MSADMRLLLLALSGWLAWSVPAGECLVSSGDAIVFAGDSITAFGRKFPHGYVNLVEAGLKANGIEIEAIGIGRSGAKSSPYWGPAITKAMPEGKRCWVTYSIGVNDVGHMSRGKGVDLPTYKTNVRATVEEVTAAGARMMLLTPTLHGEAADTENNKELAGYVAFMRELAKEKGLLLADLHADMRRFVDTADHAVEPPGRLVTCDGLHMNPVGNMVMARGVLRAFGLGDAEIATAERYWREELAPGCAVPIRVPVASAVKMALLPDAQRKALLSRLLGHVVRRVRAEQEGK